MAKSVMVAEWTDTSAPTRSRRGRKSLYRPENKAVWASFRQLRLAAKLSQEDFGNRLGRNQSFVSAVETGVVRLDALQIRDWCQAAGVTMEVWLRVFESTLLMHAALESPGP